MCVKWKDRPRSEWLWKPLIHYGSLTAIFSEYAFDASKIMLFLAAGLTRGQRLRYIGRGTAQRYESADPENVCYLAQEDMIADTGIAFFRKAGGNDKKFLYFPKAQCEVRLNAKFLRDVIAGYSIRLFVVDTFELFRPESLLLWDKESMQKTLTALRCVARETGTAVVLISDVTEPLYGRETFVQYRENFFQDADNLFGIHSEEARRGILIVERLKCAGGHTGVRAIFAMNKGFSNDIKSGRMNL